MSKRDERGRRPSPGPLTLPLRLRLVLGLGLGLALLGAAEAVLRLTRQPPGYFPRNPREDPLYVADRVLGYTLKPGAHHEYVTPEIYVAMDVSQDGLRDTTLAAARSADDRVLTIGDSFTMGLAVAREDTWSEQLERLMASHGSGRKAAVVNAGVPGYSPRQIRLRLEDLLPRIHPTIVVYGFTTETYTRMFRPFALYGGTLIRSDALPGVRIAGDDLWYSPYRTGWLRDVDYWLNRHSWLGAHVLARLRNVYQALGGPADSLDAHATLDSLRIQRDMRPALDELTAMHRDAAAQAIPLVVLLINMQRPDGSFRPQDAVYNRVVLAECRRQKLPCIDLLPQLQRAAAGRPVFRTVHDQHWTPAAHALAARAVFQTVEPWIGSSAPR